MEYFNSQDFSILLQKISNFIDMVPSDESTPVNWKELAESKSMARHSLDKIRTFSSESGGDDPDHKCPDIKVKY